ncbi:MAG: type II 3-dehydroquinate dehydratase [Ferruginibacter sp.]
MNKKIAIINGPNLNLLGQRETGIYGDVSFNVHLKKMEEYYSEFDITFFQSNVEGELINEIQKVGFSYDGIILNPGGYTHTSVAIGDAISAISCPVIEVHLSNIFAREEFRKISFVSSVCKGQITGFGLQVYNMALNYFKSM